MFRVEDGALEIASKPITTGSDCVGGPSVLVNLIPCKDG